MNNKEFRRITQARLNKTKTALLAKGSEYARGDRLSNFKEVARMLGSTPETALLGMVVKHIQVTVDFIHDIDRGVVQPYERWDEKLGDIVAYMILLEALVRERLADNEP